MKKQLFYVVLAAAVVLALWGCQTTSTKSQDAGPNGFTEENAIVMHSTNEKDGMAEEYGWISGHYPGSKVESQALLHGDKKIFDLMNVRLKDGTGVRLYFDITSYFGKWQ